MMLYGFWRLRAASRVRVALALKGMAAEQGSLHRLQGRHRTDAGLKIAAFDRSLPPRQPDAPAGAGQ